MKKIYATLILSSLIFAANAQNGRKMSKHATATIASFTKQGNNETNAIVCDTLTTMTATDSLFLYTVSSPESGYLAGNNSYADKTKATYLPGALMQPASTITGVLAIFFRDGTNNIGTKGTGAVSMNILGGDTTSGPSGAALGTAADNLQNIITNGFLTGNSLLYMFTFGTAVNAPAAGFFSSLTLPTSAGDTAVLFVTRDLSQSTYPNYAWEQWSDNSYHSFGDPNNWGLNTTLSLLPVVCYNSTGIHNNVLEASMAMYPNPSNGQLNFAMVLPEATNLTVSVVNTLGQVVFTQTENNFKGGIMKYDLTSLGKGVYFANITDSDNNKVVKKIIIE